MSQESFVLVKDLNFNDAGVQAKAGDVLVFTPPEKLVVYRAGDIVARIGFQKVSIDGLVLSGILLTEKKMKTQAPPVADPAPETPAAGDESTNLTTGTETSDAETQTAGDTETQTTGESESDTPGDTEGQSDETPATTEVKTTETPKVEEPKVEKPKAAKAEPTKKTKK